MGYTYLKAVQEDRCATGKLNSEYKMVSAGSEDSERCSQRVSSLGIDSLESIKE
jgi:hypothetical protein